MSTSDDPTRAPVAFAFSQYGHPRVDRRVAPHDRRHGAFRGGRRASDHKQGGPTTDAMAPARDPIP